MEGESSRCVWLFWILWERILPLHDGEGSHTDGVGEGEAEEGPGGPQPSPRYLHLLLPRTASCAAAWWWSWRPLSSWSLIAPAYFPRHPSPARGSFWGSPHLPLPLRHQGASPGQLVTTAERGRGITPLYHSKPHYTVLYPIIPQ